MDAVRNETWREAQRDLTTLKKDVKRGVEEYLCQML
jgi:hypothetical protein